jgi:hypothetical protein
MRRILLTLLPFVAAFALSFFVARLFVAPDDAAPAATPAFDAPIVVVMPVPAGDDPAGLGAAIIADDLALREAASEAGVPIESASVVSEPVIGGGGSMEELLEVDAAGDPFDASGDPGDEPSWEEEPAPDILAPPPPATPSGDGEPADDRVVDLCAGDPPPDYCPDGVGGIIVMAIDALPPFDGMVSFRPYHPGAAPYPYLPQCPPAPLGPGEVAVGMSANRPAEIELSIFTPRGDLIKQLMVTSSPAAEAVWEEWVLDEAAGVDDPRMWVQHCFVVDDLEPGLYEARAVFTDTLPSMDTFTYPRDGALPLHVRDEAGVLPESVRRPTFVVPVNVDRVYVNATREPGQALSVRAIAADGSCDVGGDLADLRPRGQPGVIHSLPVGTSEIPASTLAAADYPYLPLHSIAETRELDLEEGTDYVLCLAWVEGAGPTFSPERIALTEEIPIGTPEAYRVRLTVEGIDDAFGLNGSDVESVSVAVWPSWSSGCPGLLVEFSRDLAPRWSGDGTLCEGLTGVARMVRSGVTLQLYAEGFGGPFVEVVRLRVDPRCATHPCPPRSPEVALVPLPAIPTERRLCGTGFGSGCSGEVPKRSAGTAVVRIDFITREGNGLARFYVGEPRPFGTTTELPPEPRLDVRTRPVPEPWFTVVRDGLSVQVDVAADRPVTLAAELRRPGGGEACAVTPLEPTVRDVATQNHTFIVSGLCSGADYRILFSGSDADGNPVGVVPRVGAAPVPYHDFSTPLLTVPVRATVTANPETVTTARSFTAYAQVWVVSPGVAGSPEQHVDFDLDDAFRAASARYGWEFDESGRSACGRPRDRVSVVKHFRDQVSIATHEQILVKGWIIFRENREKSGGETGDDRFTCIPWNEYRYQWIDSWMLQSYWSLDELRAGVTMDSGVGRDGQQATVFVRLGG